MLRISKVCMIAGAVCFGQAMAEDGLALLNKSEQSGMKLVCGDREKQYSANMQDDDNIMAKEVGYCTVESMNNSIRDQLGNDHNIKKQIFTVNLTWYTDGNNERRIEAITRCESNLNDYQRPFKCTIEDRAGNRGKRIKISDRRFFPYREGGGSWID